jgi:hypothetical protein
MAGGRLLSAPPLQTKPRHHHGLSLPDAIALVVAEMIDADAVWRFDRRWHDVHQRVTIP